MRYINLEGHTYRSMDVNGYNYDGFYQKITYQMSLNKGRMTTTQGSLASLVKILTLLLFLSW